MLLNKIRAFFRSWQFADFRKTPRFFFGQAHFEGWFGAKQRATQTPIERIVMNKYGLWSLQSYCLVFTDLETVTKKKVRSERGEGAL